MAIRKNRMLLIRATALFMLSSALSDDLGLRLFCPPLPSRRASPSGEASPVVPAEWPLTFPRTEGEGRKRAPRRRMGLSSGVERKAGHILGFACGLVRKMSRLHGPLDRPGAMSWGELMKGPGTGLTGEWEALALQMIVIGIGRDGHGPAPCLRHNARSAQRADRPNGANDFSDGHSW
jgi:hypothetical protein